MQFDEVIEFNDELYQKNIADHTFPEIDDLDGKGGTNE
ncbi:Uncharacterised protein [Streptococcus suis]|uniref:Uncharacterized protein n=1 Tax=Streptococcus suis TaxID=1307 RepID=A0AB33UB38_STRSU|nr:hypothetical protein Javan583_0056 [Streptococcus phage Javan583]CYX61501.1 Uncharacterised protein [Streptococcus suis]